MFLSDRDGRSALANASLATIMQTGPCMSIIQRFNFGLLLNILFVVVKLLTGKKKRYARTGLFFARRQIRNELREEEKKKATLSTAGPSDADGAEGQAMKRSRR